MEHVSLHMDMLQSDYLSYESWEQTVSCQGPKLAWKLWGLAVDKHHKHRCGLWLLTMDAKTTPVSKLYSDLSKPLHLQN